MSDGVACTIEDCEPTKEMLDAALSVYRIENVGMENVRNMIRAALMARNGLFPATTETKQ